MNILVINSGSSSLKYQLLDMTSEEVIAKGICERIGIDGHIRHNPLTGDKPVYDENIDLPNHSEAISEVLKNLLSEEHGVISDVSEIHAVGHRVVHGGESFASSVIIDGSVMQVLEDCTPLAPLHNPANIVGINACKESLGDVPQVAVFDTAFHQTMQPHAYTYAIPYRYYEKYKIRRYGFHGTSHRYVAERAALMLGRPIEELKLISCHMGNGSSICAIDGGKSIDTSMGFTPIAGLPMGTRCGELDVGIIEFIMERENLSIKEVLNILNKQAGVLGISGLSSDFRDLFQAAEEGNRRSALALDIFNYYVTKHIGSYAATMNGVDAVIFTAGIGENNPGTRQAVCEKLTFLGLKLDEKKNRVHCGDERDISTDDSPNRILVIPTNEELVIAKDTLKLVSEI